MKKVIAFGAFAVLGVVALSSCKKDYTCTCTVNGGTISATYTKVKKADAEEACSSSETTYKVADASASCSL